MYIMIICHRTILHYNMSFKIIAGRSDGVFWWFSALSEDQEEKKLNSPTLSCGFKQNLIHVSWMWMIPEYQCILNISKLFFSTLKWYEEVGPCCTSSAESQKGINAVSLLFHCELEWLFCCTRSELLMPFWFSIGHNWTALTPFWPSADNTVIDFSSNSQVSFVN